ncbi:hypothetical protein HUJ05_001640 [Dendroctonus ponderosae]|nr:hypothetical protein HUJ05_001640 [Dendroctonus ponderosae]
MIQLGALISMNHQLNMSMKLKAKIFENRLKKIKRNNKRFLTTPFSKIQLSFHKTKSDINSITIFPRCEEIHTKQTNDSFDLDEFVNENASKHLNLQSRNPASLQSQPSTSKVCNQRDNDDIAQISTLVQADDGPLRIPGDDDVTVHSNADENPTVGIHILDTAVNYGSNQIIIQYVLHSPAKPKVHISFGNKRRIISQISKDNFDLDVINLIRELLQLAMGYQAKISLRELENNAGRGLINGIGSIFKTITGNLDASDGERYEKLITELQTNKKQINHAILRQNSLSLSVIKEFNKTVQQGSVTIRCNSKQDIQKLKQAAQETLKGYEEEETKLKNPRIQLVGFNNRKSRSAEEIQDLIISQNGFFDEGDSLKITFITELKNGKLILAASFVLGRHMGTYLSLSYQLKYSAVTNMDSQCEQFWRDVIALSHALTKHFAPTSISDHAEVETFYDNISEALQDKPTHYTILLGYFNAKTGNKKYESEEPLVPPDILDYATSSDIVVREGANVILQCVAKGFPKPAIAWKRETGDLITLADGNTAFIVAFYCQTHNGNLLWLPYNATYQTADFPVLIKV